MIIRDKQDLRKCVKQCVRRAQVIETHAKSGVYLGEYGVEANLRNWASCSDSLQESFEQACEGSPFSRRPAVLLAALDALQLPAHNLDKAESIIRGYEHQSYLAAVFSAMRARKVLICVPAGHIEQIAFEDERMVPLLAVDESIFAPGRYGIDYAEKAQYIAELLHSLNAKDILADNCSFQTLKYCLIPVCEDEDAVLHVYAKTKEELYRLLDLLAEHENVKVILATEEALEKELIREAASLPNLTAQLRTASSIAEALSALGTRFIPYASCANTAEEMLGSWVYAKEALWQALYDAYLLLARAGYELTREGIEADIDSLLCRNYEKLHE